MANITLEQIQGLSKEEQEIFLEWINEECLPKYDDREKKQDAKRK